MCITCQINICITICTNLFMSLSVTSSVYVSGCNCDPSFDGKYGSCHWVECLKSSALDFSCKAISARQIARADLLSVKSLSHLALNNFQSVRRSRCAPNWLNDKLSIINRGAWASFCGPWRSIKNSPARARSLFSSTLRRGPLAG